MTFASSGNQFPTIDSQVAQRKHEIEVLEAWKRGEKIEALVTPGGWLSVRSIDSHESGQLYFDKYQYRIAPKPRSAWRVEPTDGSAGHIFFNSYELAERHRRAYNHPGRFRIVEFVEKTT
jgi:hypothetical protein